MAQQETPQEIVPDGLTASYVAAQAGGHVVTNDGATFLHIKNTNGSARTLTIASNMTLADGRPVVDRDEVIAATSEQFLGPFETDIYNNSDGQLELSWSATAGVTLAVLQLPTVG